MSPSGYRLIGGRGVGLGSQALRFVVVSKKARKHQPVLMQVLRGGYTYDPKRNYIGTTYPHLRPAFKDGFYEHPVDSFLYGVIAFASPDPARDAGQLRTPDALREATKLLTRMGMIPVIPRGEDPQLWATKILEARAKSERERAEARARKAFQRDVPEEEFQKQLRAMQRGQPGFRRERASRGGYH